MKQFLEKLESPAVLAGFGGIVFVAMAVLGWQKLPYGMNFIDEGMYMADAWRMTVGDRLFPDNSTSVVRLYSVFNAFIFKIAPDITLLGFRKVQYFASLFTIIAFAAALVRWNRRYWFLPLVFAPFAFTGLDVIGMSANMSYYTYPHMFMTLHLAAFIWGLTLADGPWRYGLFVLSGLCLWAVGFSFIPLCVVYAWPGLFWAAVNWLKIGEARFSFFDLFLVIAPCVAIWLIFAGSYHPYFLRAVLEMQEYFAETSPTGSGLTLNRPALPYLAVTAIYLILVFAAQRLRGWLPLCVIVLLSAVMFVVVDSNMFGRIGLYWRGWFAAQMWTTALLVCFVAGFFAVASWWRYQGRTFSRDEVLLLIIMTAGAVYALVFTNYSGMGVLATLFAAVPMTAAVGMIILQLPAPFVNHRGAGAAAIIAVLAPFYYALAWADWKFTYFDFSPRYLTHTIEDGFAAGIKTNSVFYNIARLMGQWADKYSKPEDLALIFDETPMGYMVAFRRPALNHSWLGMAGSPSLRRDSVTRMIAENRHPKIAFRFVTPPLLFPVSLKDETFSFAGSRKFSENDPVNNYVLENMNLLHALKLNEDTWLEFFVRKNVTSPAPPPKDTAD